MVFVARMATPGGRTIKRRRAKGRKLLAPTIYKKISLNAGAQD